MNPTMEDDGFLDFSVEDATARHYEKFLRDIIGTTRALLDNVREHRTAISVDREKCKRNFHAAGAAPGRRSQAVAKLRRNVENPQRRCVLRPNDAALQAFVCGT